MAHEITANDGLVLNKVKAWHGLGTIVQDAPCPLDALRLAGLEWEVEQDVLWTYIGGGNRVQVPGYFGNYRSDLPRNAENAFLGMVTDRYTPVQNVALAQFCYDLAEAGKEGGVRCETAGSVQGGKRVWFLLKADAIQVGPALDRLETYLLVSNTHDGTGSMRITPTTVRVVCSNTLHMVVPRKENGELMGAAMVYRHTDSIQGRIAAAKQALAGFGAATVATKLVAEKLVQTAAPEDIRKQFFFEQYERDFGTVAVDDKRAVARAGSAYASFTQRWDDEMALHGGSVWGLLNAYTGLVQHDQKARGADDANRVERRVESNLFGLSSRRTQAAFDAAMQLATAI